MPRTGDLACNLGLYPDWESNQQPFGLQVGAQSTWATPASAKDFLFFFNWAHPKHTILSDLNQKWEMGV